jgi:trehalose-phosphatase
VEDKGPIIALHWRGAADEAGAAALAERIAGEARAAGLVLHRGRKVLEVRPSGVVDKGTAIESLLLGSEATAALYAGDDRTDLDAYAALDRLVASGRLASAVRVGIASAEGPAEITERADVVVDGPAGLLPILAALGG